MGRDSSVGIATRYGLDGPGIESRWGRDFPPPSRPALGPTLQYNGYRISFAGAKRPERGFDSPPLPIFLNLSFIAITTGKINAFVTNFYI